MTEREVDAPTIEMPTAEDAVAGMLLRHGFDMEARGVLQYPERAAYIAERLRTREANAGPCVAAIEALARGDLRGAADHQDLLAAIERLTTERDEARAETDRLRVAATELARSWLTPRLNMEAREDWLFREPERRAADRAVFRVWGAAIRQLCKAFDVAEPQPDEPYADRARALLERGDRRWRELLGLDIDGGDR